MSKTFLLFSNPGEIDIRAATTLGVNVKANDSPIGFFGTGLKFAIATILRNDGEITIQSGRNEYQFVVSPTKIRGQEFEIVSMLTLRDGQPQGENELGFTTDLGKAWLPWMAYRELWSNCRDEQGCETLLVDAIGKPTPGRTNIYVSGEAMELVHESRDEWLKTGVPDFTFGKVSGWRESSTRIFHHGIKVTELSERSIFTWNLNGKTQLTEDRTLGEYLAQSLIASEIIRNCQDKNFLRQILLAPEDSWEHKLPFNFFSAEHTNEAFKQTTLELYQTNRGNLNRNAVKLLKAALPVDPPKKARLTSLQTMVLDQAKSFLSSIGEPMAFEVIPVETLGGLNYQGLADSRLKVVIIPIASIDKGLKFLASTLLEEQYHLKHGFDDMTREFQTFLLDKIIAVAAEWKGRVL